jgi:hypothetical protein
MFLQSIFNSGNPKKIKIIFIYSHSNYILLATPYPRRLEVCPQEESELMSLPPLVSWIRNKCGPRGVTDFTRPSKVVRLARSSRRLSARSFIGNRFICSWGRAIVKQSLQEFGKCSLVLFLCLSLLLKDCSLLL